MKKGIDGRFIRHFKRAFTLTEVVITMLVISVVVGVSIKVTKNKLDKINSYTYYATYNILKDVTSNLYAQWRATNEDYSSLSCIHEIGDDCYVSKTVNPCDLKDSWNCSAHIGEYGITPQLCSANEYMAFIAYIEKAEELDSNYDIKLQDKVLKSLTGLDNSSTQYIIPFGTPGLKETWQCSMWANNAAIGSYTACPNGGWRFSDWCTSDNNVVLVTYKGSHSSDNVKTIPRNGKKFCELFAESTNTASSLIPGKEECKGDTISSSLTDFSSKKPDIILSNGIKIYNISKDPQKISALSGNSRGITYNNSTGLSGSGSSGGSSGSGIAGKATAGSEDPSPTPGSDPLPSPVIDIDEWGYIVYVDINFNSTDSKLWEDVFPFYITLSGRVIPLGGNDVGAFDKEYLEVSILNQVGKGHWVEKSLSYQEAACKAGYIKSSTYCGDISIDSTCDNETSDCVLKVIRPYKPVW